MKNFFNTKFGKSLVTVKFNEPIYCGVYGDTYEQIEIGLKEFLLAITRVEKNNFIGLYEVKNEYDNILHQYKKLMGIDEFTYEICNEIEDKINKNEFSLVCSLDCLMLGNKKQLCYADFIGGKRFTTYEVYRNGCIRQFNNAYLNTNVRSKYDALLLTDYKYAKFAPMTFCNINKNKCGNIKNNDANFLDREEAKQIAMSILLEELRKLTKRIEDLNNDIIEVV